MPTIKMLNFENTNEAYLKASVPKIIYRTEKHLRN